MESFTIDVHTPPIFPQIPYLFNKNKYGFSSVNMMNDPLPTEKTTRYPHTPDMTCHATLSFKLFSLGLSICLSVSLTSQYENPTFQPSHLTRSLILFYFPKKQAVWRGITGASLCCL